MSYLQSACNTLFKIKFKVIATIGIVVGGVIISIRFYKKTHEKNKKPRKTYPKDVVILHQMPREFKSPSPYAEALKLETWLRMANISYKNEFSSEMWRENPTLLITYNSVELTDSQNCIDYLSKIFDKNLNSKLDKKQLAIARCVVKTCEESLRWCVVLHRFIYSANSFECGLNEEELNWTKHLILRSTYSQGYGRHSKEEVYSIGTQDLKALNKIIGTNKFLFGNEVCDADAALFSSLAQILFHDLGPLHEYATRNCLNISRYVRTMRKLYWPEWDVKIN